MSNSHAPGGLCRGWRLAAYAVVLLMAALALAADKPGDRYAVIVGTVWNAQDLPAGGVRIKIRRADQNKARWELVSNARGEFVQRVPAESADYVVWAEIKGRKGPVAETRVHVVLDERQDIGLHLPE